MLNRVDEADHHGVGYPPKQPAKPEQPGGEHDEAGEYRQREERPRRIVPYVDSRHILHDDGHGPVAWTTMNKAPGKRAPVNVPTMYA